jgi:hypothetical protein
VSCSRPGADHEPLGSETGHSALDDEVHRAVGGRTGGQPNAVSSRDPTSHPAGTFRLDAACRGQRGEIGGGFGATADGHDRNERRRREPRRDQKCRDGKHPDRAAASLGQTHPAGATTPAGPTPAGPTPAGPTTTAGPTHAAAPTNTGGTG